MTAKYILYTAKRSGAASVEVMLRALGLANLSRWWKMREYLKDSHPTFAAMMQRVDRLPVVAPVWKRHWP